MSDGSCREEVKKTRHVVLGGGASGLWATKELLRSDIEVILIEYGFDEMVNNEYQERLNQENKVNSILSWPQWRLWRHLSKWWTWDMTAGPNLLKIIESAPQIDGLLGRSVNLSTGKGLGGSTNINAMLSLPLDSPPGIANVYDELWPEGWEAERFRLWRQKIELLFPSQFVRTSGKMQELLSSLLSSEHTTGEYQVSSRSSGERLWLSSILGDDRNNPRLKLFTGWTAEKLFFAADGKTIIAVKIRCRSTGEIRFIKPRSGGEVILSLGALETPRFLAASIRSARQFRQTRSMIASRLPIEPINLGKQLLDHVLVPMLSIGNWSSGWSRWFNDGTPDLPVNGIHGWVYLDSQGKPISATTSTSTPVCQVLLVDGYMCAALSQLVLPNLPHWRFYSSFIRPSLLAIIDLILSTTLGQWLCGQVFGALVCLVQPKSTGQLRFSKNASSITADPGYLSHNDDVKTLSLALKFTQSSFQSSGVGVEVLPGPLFSWISSDWWTNLYLQLFSTSYFHYCGTASMPLRGISDEKSVVDTELRVRGFNNLRIADASVIPALPAGPIAHICMSIGIAVAENILNSSNRSGNQTNKCKESLS